MGLVPGLCPQQCKRERLSGKQRAGVSQVYSKKSLNAVNHEIVHLANEEGEIYSMCCEETHCRYSNLSKVNTQFVEYVCKTFSRFTINCYYALNSTLHENPNNQVCLLAFYEKAVFTHSLIIF